MKDQEDLEQSRARAEREFVPALARLSGVDAEEYERRRGDPEAMTLTKLHHLRRCELVEYNMENFPQRRREHPTRHSDRAEPWWTSREGYVPDPPPCLLNEMRALPEKLTEKVTEIAAPSLGSTRRGPAGQAAQAQSQAQPKAVDEVPFPYNEFGQRTIKRWTTEFVPAGLACRVPRLFDNIDGVVDGVKQAPQYSSDSLPLHAFSTVEHGRSTAGLQDSQPHTAREPRGPRAPGGEVEGAVGIGMQANVQGTTSQVSLGSSRGSSRFVPAQAARLPVPLIIDDPPMTERLDRSRRSGKAGPGPGLPADALTTTTAGLDPTGRSGSCLPAEGTPGARSGHAASAAAAAAALAAVPPQMVVRTSGFQWLEGNAVLQNEGLLLRMPRCSVRSLTRETPRSSRTVQGRVKAPL